MPLPRNRARRQRGLVMTIWARLRRDWVIPKLLLMHTTRLPRRNRTTLACSTTTKRLRCTNAGKLPEAGAAADKAIAADPKKADAYYIKGQSLIPGATVDAKTQKVVAPPGCVEAYQQYLELAPDGPHAGRCEGYPRGHWCAGQVDLQGRKEVGEAK